MQFWQVWHVDTFVCGVLSQCAVRRLQTFLQNRWFTESTAEHKGACFLAGLQCACPVGTPPEHLQPDTPAAAAKGLGTLIPAATLGCVSGKSHFRGRKLRPKDTKRLVCGHSSA